MEQGRSKVVLLCDQRLRPHLGALLARSVPQLPLVAYNELQVGTPIRQLASISLAQAELAPAGLAGVH
jgi:flagellar biosynthesis component FlhA